MEAWGLKMEAWGFADWHHLMKSRLRIRIRIEVKSLIRIQIRTEVKSLIQIRIKCVMRIRNPGVKRAKKRPVIMVWVCVHSVVQETTSR